MEKIKAEFSPGWYTIPEFEKIVPVNLYHKETEAGQEPCSGPQNLHVLARGEVDLDAGQLRGGRVILRITADDYYKAYINGSFVGQGPAPAYPEAYYYNQIDITAFVKPGKNLIAVHAYYQGLVNRVWNSGDGRFALAADIVTIENHQETVLNWGWSYTVSGAYSGEITGYDTQFLENFDSRLWDEDWNQPKKKESGEEGAPEQSEGSRSLYGSDRAKRHRKPSEPDSMARGQRWQGMVPARWADYQLCMQPTRMLQIYEITPAVFEKRSGSCWFVDVGQEVAGNLILTARGVSGQRIRILCGEELNRDGSVRYELRCNCRYEEIWTLGSGICTLEPYDYKGFRYCQIEAEEGVELLEARIRIRHYPFDEGRCTLKTGDEVLDAVFDLCRQTVRYGTQEGYLDCPTREKGQYLGDAVIASRAQVWLSGSTELLRKCIDQFAKTGKICPGLMAVAPGALMQEIADFSLLWGELLLTDYQFTGDKEYLAKYYPTARGIIEYFRKYQRADGLLYQVAEKWNLVDWPEGLRDGYDFTLSRPTVAPGYHNVINALYVGAVKTLTELEEILDYPVSYDWESLRDAYIRMFYRADKGLFADSADSDHTALASNIYPLYFSLVPDSAAESVAKFLKEKGLSCGVMLSYFFLKGLARYGYYKEVYDLLVNQSEYGWVNMLREGATTCLEVWGKEQKWNTSCCHPWATAPIPLIIEDLCRIRPDERNKLTLNIPLKCTNLSIGYEKKPC